MRHDNKGMSLVELILAMTMATVVMGAAMLFLRTALNTYTLADANIDVQREAQMNMEQVGTWIMQGNRIAAGATTVVSGDTVVTTNSVSENTVSESILVVLDVPHSKNAGDYSAEILAGAGTGGLKLADCDTDVKVFWLGTSGKLYMLHLSSSTSYATGSPVVTINGGTVSGNTGAFDPANFGSGADELNYIKLPGSYTPANLAAYEDDDHVLAEYVTDFKAYLTEVKDSTNNLTGNIVNVSLSYGEETVKYTVSNQYTIRNLIKKSDE